jgi:ATP adenylyltransferase
MSRPSSHSAAVLGYNLVLTDRWFLAVPRTQSSYLGIEVNGMGFFGALLAQDKETAEVIKRVGPINILKGVVPPHV